MAVAEWRPIVFHGEVIRRFGFTNDIALELCRLAESCGAGAMYSKRPQKDGDEEFMSSLRSNPAYAHIDIDSELGKMKAWVMCRPGRQITRRFIVNWLNKIDKPVRTLQPQTKQQPKPTKPNPVEECAPPPAEWRDMLQKIGRKIE